MFSYNSYEAIAYILAPACMGKACSVYTHLSIIMGGGGGGGKRVKLPHQKFNTLY